MIRSFRGKDAEAIWHRRYVKRLSPALAKITYDKLALINAAENINDQWRLCFTWSASGASNVELVDYH